MHWPNVSSDPWDTFFVIMILSFWVFGVGGPILNIPLFTRNGALLAYSKFAKGLSKVGITVPTRSGMTIIYAPAGIFGAAFYWNYAHSDRGKLASVMMMAHFGKRIVKSWAVHNYSGRVPLATSCFISAFYVFCSVTSCWCGEAVGGEVTGSQKMLGVLAFAFGLGGNLYHHRLLANLRKPGEKSYKIPRGGLFECVAAPHYLFELIGWLGVTIVCDHFTVVLMWMGFVGYLVDRARAQTAYNRKKIDGYPSDRGHILPFIF